MSSLCVKSMQAVPCGTCDKGIANGVGFYSMLYDKHPDLRHYFKGAESWTPSEVTASDRFRKQGQRLLLAIHVLAHLENDEASFKAYCRDIVDRHLRVGAHLESSIWNAFWPIWLDYLASKTTVDEATRTAWLTLGKKFSDECLTHVKNITDSK